MIREGFGGASAARVRLVRGSHIVTRKLFDHDRAYIFQQADGRVVFAIPYEGDFTLIGTTDMEHDGAAGRGRLHARGAGLSARARSPSYFRAPVGVGDIVWSYSGVRPLYDDGASSATAATRDYVLSCARRRARRRCDVFGGKITTYRRLSEAVLAKLAGVFPRMGGLLDRAARRCRAGTFRWTGGAALAGELRGAVPVPRRRLGGAAGARLRHRGGGDAGRRAHRGGPRRALRLGL